MAAFTKNIIDPRLAMYTLAASTLAAGSAHAVPTTSPSTFPLSAEDSEVYIDINDDGEWDFKLTAYSSDAGCDYNGGSAYLEYNPAYGGGIQKSVNSGYAGMISDGSSVPGGTFNTFSYITSCDNDLGQFPVPSSGFVGVEFYIGQNLHYGYLAVETSEGSLIATVLGACFESTPDTAIGVDACNLVAAADTPDSASVSVPVGGLIPLSLAALALGAAASRRRRRIQ